MTNDNNDGTPRVMPSNLIDAVKQTTDVYERGLRQAVETAGLLDETVAHTAMVGYMTAVRDMLLLAAYTPEGNSTFFQVLDARGVEHMNGNWTVELSDTHDTEGGTPDAN